ncbi:FAD-dependent monooxygenase [Lentzea sp. NPDC060358]|uniref:FAD-dependent monooxygenase n=1 Tax=Lentzea sp. NPDC060358 TaxID=3347103 RepID=UPI00364DFBEE
MITTTCRSVLVSGAGISGLTTAFWLLRHGFDVTVVEQSPGPRPGGHALDVRGPALEVARRMGIDTALHERSTHLKGVSAVDASGAEVFRSTESTLTGGRLDSEDVEILRDALCEVLRDAVGDGAEYLYGDSVTALTQDGSGVDVAFAHAAPRRFDLVIGADGVGSAVRRIAFGPDERFVRAFGDLHVAVFSMPNFLGLDRWEVTYQRDDPFLGALVMGLGEGEPAKAYLGFSAQPAVGDDVRDVAAQKRLLADRLAGGGWELPALLAHMRDAPDFHFYRLSQVRLDRWSRGRVVLVGDAGYAVSLGTGQATSVAMTCSYVLAGELARHRDAPEEGLAAYEGSLRDYVLRNQDIALESGQDDPSADGLPDFGALTLPYELEDYEEALRRS